MSALAVPTIKDRADAPCPCGRGLTVGAILTRGTGDLVAASWRCSECIVEAAGGRA